LNETEFRRLISGESTGATAVVLRAMLRCLSVCYRMIVAARNAGYQYRWLAIHRTRAPVISIGNITTGGTGKTPVVALVVHILQSAGRIPGIISRGYRSDVSGTNDEYRVLAAHCPGVPHEQYRDRVMAAERLLQSHPINVIVMDDGFQHRRLHRDLDIVLIDLSNPFGYGFLLPRGLLREPLSALKRADIVLLTRCDVVSAEHLQHTEELLLRLMPHLSENLFPLQFAPAGVIDTLGNRCGIEILQGKRVFLMCAVGNPEAFVRTCENAGTVVAGHHFFSDHHHYSDDDLAVVQNEFLRSGADLVLTTQKDLVKLPPERTDILAIELTAQFVRDGDSQRFAQRIRSALANSQNETSSINRTHES
jgi:tetraacyldisaccharide 4'-kinase